MGAEHRDAIAATLMSGSTVAACAVWSPLGPWASLSLMLVAALAVGHLYNVSSHPARGSITDLQPADPGRTGAATSATGVDQADSNARAARSASS